MKNSLCQDLSLHGIGWTLFPANPPLPRFALSVITKDLHFQNNHKIHPCSLVLLSESQTKAFSSLPYLTEGGVQHSIPATTARDLQLGFEGEFKPWWKWPKFVLVITKKKHNQKTNNSAAFSAKSVKCQTLYSECFMKNFARRCFNALCYKYSEAILCKWVKPVNTL